MTCLNKTYPSVTAMPIPARRPGFFRATIVLIETFQDALDMMRAVHRRHRLNE